jgi:rhodanese-related sulfurtransferase
MTLGQPTVPTVDVAGAESEASAALLLDVREASEWIHGHVADSVNVPLGHLADHVASLDPQQRIVCICRSGNRSGMATALLCDAGFDAVNMRGGMLAWAASGRPVVDRNGQPGVVA